MAAEHADKQPPSSFEDVFPAGRSPYAIQQGFMRCLYACLQLGGVALLESPTGTGKTISIICAALKWLEDERERTAAAAAAQAAADQAAAFDDDDPDWLKAGAQPAVHTAAAASTQQQVPTNSRRAQAEARRQQRASHHQATSEVQTLTGNAPQRKPAPSQAPLQDDLDQFVLDEVADAEAGGLEREGGVVRKRVLADLGSSSEDSEGEGGRKKQRPEEVDTRPNKTQIIFCSRTHSQLSQFVSELRRTGFADRLSVVALASRGVLCVNEEVRKLEAANLINERCLDLQQERASAKRSKATDVDSVSASRPQQRKRGQQQKTGGCPHLVSGGPNAEAWADEAVLQPMDVEDLARHGKHHGVCPYYGARTLLRDADIVLAPYSSVLLPEARQALGLWLQGAVLVVDEAHNLVDAVNAGHSACVTASQLCTAHDLLTHYWDRFSAHFSARNAQSLQLLLKVVHKLVDAVHLPPPQITCPPPTSATATTATAATATATKAATAAPTAAATATAAADSAQLDPDPMPHAHAASQSLNKAAASKACTAAQPQHSNNAAATHKQAPAAEAAAASAHSSSSVAATTVNDFLFESELEHINLFSLLAWVKESRVLQKLSGYTKWQQQQQQKQQGGSGEDTKRGVIRYEQPASVSNGASIAAQKSVSGSRQNSSGVKCESGSRQNGSKLQGSSSSVRGSSHGSVRGSSHGSVRGCSHGSVRGCSKNSAEGGSCKGDRLGALHATLSFISSLTNVDSDGRVIVSKQQQQQHQQQQHHNQQQQQQQQQQGGLKFVLLNAAAHFAQVLGSCRSVVLASGTLAPVQGLTAQLFPHMTPYTHSNNNNTAATASVPCPPLDINAVAQSVQRSCPARLLGVLQPRSGRGASEDASPTPVIHYECGHVVPKEQVAVLVAGVGPSGQSLTLRHNTRAVPEVMDEVGRLLTNICTATPDGVVAFMPSFAYLEQLMSRWTATGAIAGMAARKHVFREPRGASEVEAVLQQYAAAIHTSTPPHTSSTTPSVTTAANAPQSYSLAVQPPPQSTTAAGGSVHHKISARQAGALLLAVVGGKLSEGINFGDRLGRCVVVCGMPYANPSDPELCQRMAYWDGQASGLTGQQLYEAMCMNAVNQCVGRVVRHAGDYAAIVLADARYLAGAGGRGQAAGGEAGVCSSSAPIAKLPRWLQQSLESDRVQGFGFVYSRLVAFMKRQAAKTQDR